MPRLAANLTMLFNEAPFLERFALAARHGFDAVEFLFPYGLDAGEIRGRLDEYGLRLVLHNLPPGDWDGGERGMACHPGRETEFRESVRQGIAYARALGVGQLNCLAGKRPVGVDEATLRRTLVGNLRHAAAAFADAGLKLLIEPINTYDMPGFYLNRTQQAVEILDEVGAANAFVQYDLYHAQRMEGEIAGTVQRYLSRIGHMQLADNPGRHEPGTGEMNYAFIFEHLDRIGYPGWIGCEYKPLAGTEAGLGWRERLLPPATM